MSRRNALLAMLLMVLPMALLTVGLTWSTSPTLAWCAGMAVLVEGGAVMLVAEIAARRRRREVQRSHDYLDELDVRLPPPPDLTYPLRPEYRDF